MTKQNLYRIAGWLFMISFVLEVCYGFYFWWSSSGNMMDSGMILMLAVVTFIIGRHYLVLGIEEMNIFLDISAFIVLLLSFAYPFLSIFEWMSYGALNNGIPSIAYTAYGYTRLVFDALSFLWVFSFVIGCIWGWIKKRKQNRVI